MLKVDDVISLLETIPTKENRKKTFPNKVIFNMNFRIKEHFRRTNNPPQKVPQKGEPYQLIGEDVKLSSSRHLIELLRFLWGGGYEDPIRIRGKEIIRVGRLIIPHGYINHPNFLRTPEEIQKDVERHMGMWEIGVGLNRINGKPFKYSDIMTFDGLFTYDEAYIREKKLIEEQEKTSQRPSSNFISVQMTLDEAIDLLKRNILQVYISKETFNLWNANDKTFMEKKWTFMDK
tara:strand:+ start:3726 stop:4424 length:699 start_codon:yes stop_codon:yes gene_type:complete